MGSNLDATGLNPVLVSFILGCPVQQFVCVRHICAPRHFVQLKYAPALQSRV